MGHKYVKEDEVFTTSQNGTVPKPTAQDVSNNKFLRADGTWQAAGGGGGATHNYSTTEQIIGTWIDGKPVYEKTFDLGETISVSYTGWTVLNSVMIADLSAIISAKGRTQAGTFSPFMAGKSSNGAVEVQTPRNGNAQALYYLTLEYTKSTD